jgi:energy-coupling factor transporter transmembrane protein EcfT
MNNWIYIILASIAVIIVFKVAKSILKAVLVVALIVVVSFVLLYSLGIGPFQKNVAAIKNLEEKYCKEESQKNKCDCIVKPISKDLYSRFSEDELDSLFQDKGKSAYLLYKSYKAQTKVIEDCLEKRNAQKEKLEFIQDLLPIKLSLDKIANLFDNMESKIDSSNQDIKTINSRY